MNPTPKIIEYNPFNAATVALQGSNLIEASAGTGKTYSIALLVLRLVIEEGIPLREILMVTFTRAAVAELQTRIRFFISQSSRCAEGEPIKDAAIADIVDKGKALHGEEKLVQMLRDTRLLIDEMAVQTIHGFCQLTLREFAFETGQPFTSEQVSLDSLLEEALNKFWRRHVNTLPALLLTGLDPDVVRAQMAAAVQNHLGGKTYFGYEERTKYRMSDGMTADWVREMEGKREAISAGSKAVHEGLKAAFKKKKQLAEVPPHGDAKTRAYSSDLTHFGFRIGDDKERDYIKKHYPEFGEATDTVFTTKKELDDLQKAAHRRINNWAISEITGSILAAKERAHQMTFDDMIDRLHQSACGAGGEVLGQKMRGKYKAVFVDEFQDTDKKQWEIFDAFFGADTTLFFIGDPKQSIYGFRAADIHTYFNARAKVEKVWSMNHNYRSAPQLLEALNNFFLPAGQFDTFLFTPQEHSAGKGFGYIPVQSPAGVKKGLCANEEGTTEAPLTIVEIDKGVGMPEEVAAARQIKVLLQGGYTVQDSGGPRPVRPSDIGVLVRFGYQGVKIQNELMGMGIASVRVNETKVLKTAEAVYFTLILEAILSPSVATINRALLTPITPFTTEELRHLDDEKVVSRFAAYRERWARDGIYTALSAFLSDFEVERHLLLAGGGQRALANVLHLAELLHTVQMRKGYSEIKLLSWLHRAISDDKRNEGGEFEMRIERDDEAVNIVTIHKSKGLEYGIVIAPFLNFQSEAANAKKPERHMSYRDNATKRYYSVEKWRMLPSQRQAVELQENQESRRLLYVALTRAVHGCYLFLQGGTSGHFLDKFLVEARRHGGDSIGFAPPILRMPELKPQEEKGPETSPAEIPKVHFKMRQPRWQRMSYTGIHAAGERHPFPKATEQEAEYDAFMFQTLKRGSKTGNLLHHLLENANLAEDKLWDKAIASTLRKHLPLQAEAYTPLLRQMLTEVGSARIQPAACSGEAGSGNEAEEFSLADVSGYKRLAELEFDYPVAPFSAPLLNALSTEDHPFSVRADLKDAEGIMTGKIDFFFEQGGKYYVLDWKSNYLGDTVEAYAPEHFAEAMKRENYHLQYLIYSLAACKYLHQRIPGFDYERDFGGAIYLFVRGVRAGSAAGVFVAKPPAELLEKLDGVFGK